MPNLHAIVSHLLCKNAYLQSDLEIVGEYIVRKMAFPTEHQLLFL